MTLHDRRSFLATLGQAAVGGAALVATGCAKSAAIQAAPPPPVAGRTLRKIGLQLYTVRQQARTDLPGTLAQLAKMGYTEIEFWGSPALKAAEIRKVLDDNGLASPSVHVGFPTTDAAFDKIFEDARAMGHQWITVPSLPSGPKQTVDDWKRIASQFNVAGMRIKDAGFKYAFHNHTEEFKKVSGTVPLDILIVETDPSLVSFELDICWVVAGGGDPMAYLKRFPKRITMVHVKDNAGPPDFKQTDVGAGKIAFGPLLAQATQNGVEHYFVESDGPADPMGFLRSSYSYLSRLEF